MVNKTNLDNREILIKEVINDLENLLDSPNLDQKLIYTIKENINFFKATKNYITYVLWLLFKAPFLKKELILEISELGITKWKNKLYHDLLENEKKFKWMLNQLVNYIKNCIVEGKSQIIGNIGCENMETELQIIKNLIAMNFNGEILFIGSDNSINALISAKNNLKEIENYIDFYFEENIDENRVSSIFYHKRNQFVIVLTREGIFNLSNKFRNKFFDVVFHAKFKHHLSDFQREELDRILNINEIIISAIAFITIFIWQKFVKKIPGSLVAIIVTTIVVQLFNLNVDTIGKRFGTINATLGIEFVPDITFEKIKLLIQPAFTIAMLAAIESLLSAVVADGMIGGKHRSNTELIAQGIANIASSIFGGIPATGAIARTATNIKNGGRTPVAGMVHAITLLLILLFFGSYAKLIPMATLAVILVIVSYNMSEWRSFVKLLRSPKHDVVVLLVTFCLTVLFDLTIAIEIGLLMAVFLFMYRMSQVTNVGIISKELEDVEEYDPAPIASKHVPNGVEVFEINGPFFFGAVDKFKETISNMENKPKVRIIRMRHVNAIDSTGLHTLEELHKDCQKRNIKLFISGIHAQPLKAMMDSGLYDIIGEENFVGNIDEALEKANEYLRSLN